MKKQTLGIRAPVWTLAFCLFALVFASCGEPGDPAKASPPPPDTRKLSFENVVIEYQKDSEALPASGFVFSKTKQSASFEAEHDKAKDGYHLNIKVAVPPNVDWTLVSGEDKESLKKTYKKLRTEVVDEEGKKEWKDISESIASTESPEWLGLPVPRLDPLYDVFLEPDPDTNIKSSYKEIKLTFELKLKADVDTKFTDTDGLEYEWEDSTYVLTIKEQDPGKKNFTDEEKVLIDKKIEDAEKAIKAFEMLVGNPKLTSEGGDNDAEAVEISEIMDELVVLKEGITEYMYFETTTLPDGTRVGTENHEDGSSNYAELEASDKGGWCYYGQNDLSQIVYMVKQAYQIYDTPMILYKATELDTKLKAYIAYCAAIPKSPRLVVKKLRLEYLTAEQAGTGNTDRVQTVGIASKGKYNIELVGGSGGHVWTGSNMTTTGGKAARVLAKYTFDPVDKTTDSQTIVSKQKRLGFRIGGEGIGTAILSILNDPKNSTPALKKAALIAYWKNPTAWKAQKPGGFNGGGSGGKQVGGKLEDYFWAPGSSGGGATDVRFYDGDSKELFDGSINFDPATDARFMVAAGGGGSCQSSDGGSAYKWIAFTGGHAGVAGQLNLKGKRQGDGRTETVLSDTQFSYIPWIRDPMPPGGLSYQKADSANGDNGANGDSTVYEGSGGGGGGFKGGEARIGDFKRSLHNNSGAAGSATGAGGSSHIRKTGMTVSNEMLTLYDQYGNGYAIIEWKEGVK